MLLYRIPNGGGEIMYYCMLCGAPLKKNAKLAGESDSDYYQCSNPECPSKHQLWLITKHFGLNLKAELH
ncbi:MAG: hypothetical protein WC238_03300 [Parcubacteria group bacterium]|jgi:hypothetical protein